jgi:hypothetical protein
MSGPSDFLAAALQAIYLGGDIRVVLIAERLAPKGGSFRESHNIAVTNVSYA